VKSFKLDWKGWWLLRTPMSNVRDLEARTAVFAVIGARLKKVGTGVGSTAREVVAFGSYQGAEPVREFLEKVQKMSLGVFVTNRCKEIRKYPLVYVAAVDDATPDDLSAILSLLYEVVPYAPKHPGMPKPYQGDGMHLANGGKNPGLPEEVFRGGHGNPEIRGSEATVVPEADAAMAQAIAQEVAATQRVSPGEDDVNGIATERVAKPQGHFTTEKVDKPPTRPKMVETTRIDSDSLPQGLDTERVDKPSHYGDEGDDDKTEFVPRPEGAPLSRQKKSAGADGPTVLDEA
jgi:hypothetical protein